MDHAEETLRAGEIIHKLREAEGLVAQGLTHDGHVLKILVLIDEYGRTCLALRIARRIRSNLARS